jgi:hypothetical protein
LSGLPLRHRLVAWNSILDRGRLPSFCHAPGGTLSVLRWYAAEVQPLRYAESEPGR